MESFNGKVLLTSKLYPPQFSFDGDLRKLKFDLRDERDNSIIEYSLNGDSLNGETLRAVPFKQMDYTLPKNDKLYNVFYTLIPTKNKYKGYSGSFSIYQNHIRCKEYRYGTQYGDDDKDSQSIYAYIGTSNTVWIPEKHNMKDTTYARLTEFPYVISTNYLYITTPSEMDSFWIKGDMIREFTIKSPKFQPTNAQFKDLGNLRDIIKQEHNDWINIPQECFMNCVSFNPANDFFFENTEEIQLNGLYNTPSLKTLLFNGLYTSDYGQPKVVFTKQQTIDTRNEKVLYDNPISNTNTVFVGVSSDPLIWSGASAASGAFVKPLGFNESTVSSDVEGIPCEGNSYIFEASDPNIVGYRFTRRSSGYTTAKMVHIPQQEHNYQADMDYYEQGTPIDINSADYTFINKTTGKKYFVISAAKLNNNQEGHLLDESDIVSIQGFDKNGYLDTIITKRLDGKLFPTFQHKVAFWTKTANSTLQIREDSSSSYTTFAENVPAYRLYLYLDSFNTEKVRVRVMDRDENACYPIVLDTLENAFHKTSNPYIWYIDLAEWMDINRILALRPYTMGMTSRTNWASYLSEMDDMKFDIKLVHMDDSDSTPVSGTDYNTREFVPATTANRFSNWEKLSFTIN